MGIRRRLAPLLVALAALGAPDDAAAQPPVLRVGTSGDYAPFSALTAGAPPAFGGFDVAVARAYAEERGLALELVRFRWPKLLDELAAERFDVAMSGVTVRPRRSAAGRFTVPVAESGAVVLFHDPGRWQTLDALDRRSVRIGVNVGGHLEQVTRARFKQATLVFIADNASVRTALIHRGVDAAVTDTLEAPLWRRHDEALGLLGPFTRDRKAYLVRADRPALAADLDAWLLARERDGSLGRLRSRYLGDAATAQTATPLGALVAAIDERLSLMPLVATAKRRDARPIAAPRREEQVLAAAVAAVGAAAERARTPAPPQARVRALFRAQIAAAREVQMAAGRDPSYQPGESIPDLDAELRPALLRIGERIAALLVALPEALDPGAVQRACREGLRAPWLPERARLALAETIAQLSRAPRAPAQEPGDPGAMRRQ